MRAVLDPNVLVSALISRSGTPARFLERGLAGEFDLVVSDALLAELERALAYPRIRARVAGHDAAELIALLRETAIVGADEPSPPPRAIGPGDDYLLSLAQAEQALLVSGDSHLIALSARFPVRTPAEFLAALERQPSP